MKRREFLMVLGAAVIARPLMPCAQKAASIRRVGVLSGFPENDPVVIAYTPFELHPGSY
jgi:hypothetical protein